MFANSSHLLAAVVMCLTLLACAAEGAPDTTATPVVEPTETAEQRDIDSRCDPDGNCGATLDTVPQAVEICDGMSPNLYWRSGKPNLLLACECNCTSHDNKGWFIFSDQKKVQGVGLGKPATPESLHNVDRIPDIMASHPLCNGIDSNELGTADFVTLIKYPTGEDASPYCFKVKSIQEVDGGTHIVENGQVLDIGEEEIFFETGFEMKREILHTAKSALNSANP